MRQAGWVMCEAQIGLKIDNLIKNVSSAACLTHGGRVTHMCVGKLTIIGSDNGLSPGRRQAIIWTNAGILLIGPLGTNFNEILIGIQIFSFKKMHLKMSSVKWRPFCIGLIVFTHWGRVMHIYINKLGQAIIRLDQMTSHYLHQCWHIVNYSLGNNIQWNFNRNSKTLIQEYAFRNTVCKIAGILFEPQCAK